MFHFENNSIIFFFEDSQNQIFLNVSFKVFAV